MIYLIIFAAYCVSVVLYYFGSAFYYRKFGAPEDTTDGELYFGVFIWPIVIMLVLTWKMIKFMGFCFAKPIKLYFSLIEGKKTTDKLLEERTETYRQSHCKECGHQI